MYDWETALKDSKKDINHLVNCMNRAYGINVFLDKDDLKQVSYIALFKACNKYDPDRENCNGQKSSFRTFARRVIYNTLITFCKKHIDNNGNEFIQFFPLD